MKYSEIKKQNKSFSKKYKISTANRIFSLGIKKYGAKIVSGELRFLGLFIRNKILIKDIERISYERRKSGKGSSYHYIIIDKSGKEHISSYLFWDKVIYQDLLNDLLMLNPKIEISQSLDEFLTSKFRIRKLKFDFNVNKDDIFKNDREFSQNHPSLDLLIGLTIIILIFTIIGIFGFIGESFLIEKFGSHYPIYKIVFILIGGIFFSLAIVNILSALLSMYFGHKVTIISLVISILTLGVAFL